MLVQRGRGVAGLGDESITVSGDWVPVEYAPVDIQVPDSLTLTGSDNSTLDLSGMFPWLGGGPELPTFFPQAPGVQPVFTQSGGGGSVNALTNLAAQIAGAFKPGASTAGRPVAGAARVPAPAASVGDWISQNMLLVVGGGVGLVLLLALMKGRR